MRFITRSFIGVAALAIIAGVGVVTYRWTADRAFRTLERSAEDRLALYESSLEATVERFRYLPHVVGQAQPIIDLLHNPHDITQASAANRFLEELNEATAASDLFVMDASGLTIAASNWNKPVTFLGQSYAFRPYFRDAMATGEGRFYARGATTGIPGYFLARGIEGDGRMVGVAVVKIDLEPLEKNWAQAGEFVALADRADVLFLVTQSGWRFLPTQPLTKEARATMLENRQYGPAPPDADPLFARTERVLGRTIYLVRETPSTPAGRYLVHRRQLASHGWTLLFAAPVRPVEEQAAVAAGAAGLAALALLLALGIAYQRRQVIRAKLVAHSMLEQRVMQRTAELRESNERLQSEIEERLRTERELRQAQQGLIQAAKLASLGQALAGVAHEINQPLAALRTYMASLKLLVDRGDREGAQKTFGSISGMLERMAALTGHLKTFARQDTGAPQATDLVQAVRNAIELVAFRVEAGNVATALALPNRPVHVLGNAIRLEQVVLNLLTNALDAMEDVSTRRLSVRVRTVGSDAQLMIADSGTGIPEELQHAVFDPFFTTKEVGKGLGLGLSITYGIVRDMNGKIELESAPGRGTIFRVTLPLYASQDNIAELAGA